MLALRFFERCLQATDALASLRPSSRPSAPHLDLGKRGEEAAYFYLRRHGLIVVARDWRSGKAPGDLDLIAWEADTLCFVEVKTRSTRDVATAESAVDTHKTQVLRRLARQYLLALPDPPDHTRFDILSIYYEGDRPTEFQWFRSAFDWRAHPENR